jgi:hypothetical protein
VPTRLQDSDGEKSDQELVVDIANETVSFEKSRHEFCEKQNKKISQKHCTMMHRV